MRYLSRKVVLVVAVIASAVMPVAGQTPAQKPQFEVASVKPSAQGPRSARFTSSGGRFFATSITLRTLLQLAYQPQDGTGLMNSRIIGAPGWIDTDRFDVEAKTAEQAAGPIPREKFQSMLQSLFEDRFQLKAHQEAREIAVYLLTVAKGGSKLKLSEDQSEHYGNQAPSIPIEQQRGMMMRTKDGMRGNAVSLSFLTSFLSTQAGRPVLDKTGLTGLFDFNLSWTPPPITAPGVTAGPDVASDPVGLSIFTAIQEIGLKLESAKASLDVLVIDSVQKPSEN